MRAVDIFRETGPGGRLVVACGALWLMIHGRFSWGLSADDAASGIRCRSGMWTWDVMGAWKAGVAVRREGIGGLTIIGRAEKRGLKTDEARFVVGPGGIGDHWQGRWAGV